MYIHTLIWEPIWNYELLLYRALSFSLFLRQGSLTVGFSVELRTLFLKILKATQKQKGTPPCITSVGLLGEGNDVFRSSMCREGLSKSDFSRVWLLSKFTYVCFKGGIYIYIYESCEGPSHVSFPYCGIWIWKICLVLQIHPRNLTWNLKIMDSKWAVLFQGLIFRFHVKFRGCMSYQPSTGFVFNPWGPDVGTAGAWLQSMSKRSRAPEAPGMWVANEFFYGLLFTKTIFSLKEIPSRELTYPPKMAFWRWFFPFPKVGYVNSLEGRSCVNWK